MLLKILILAVIAWYVLKAMKNLIRAVTGEKGIPGSASGERGPERTIHRRPEAVHDRSGGRGKSSGRYSGSEASSVPPGGRASDDVEDAKFRDL